MPVETLLVVIATALVIAPIFALVVLAINEKMLRPKELGGLKEAFLTQELVDQKLAALAVAFHTASQEEIGLQRRESFTDLDEAWTAIKRARDRVAGAKQAFWDAHTVAKDCGFKVSESYKNYLPDRQAGLPVPAAV